MSFISSSSFPSFEWESVRMEHILLLVNCKQIGRDCKNFFFQQITNNLETVNVVVFFVSIAVDNDVTINISILNGRLSEERLRKYRAHHYSRGPIINGIEMNNDHTYKICKSTLTPTDRPTNFMAVLAEPFFVTAEKKYHSDDRNTQIQQTKVKTTKDHNNSNNNSSDVGSSSSQQQREKRDPIHKNDTNLMRDAPLFVFRLKFLRDHFVGVHTN